MSSVWRDTAVITVRHKGGIDEVGHHLNRLDGDRAPYGNRRSRQIARRHWLKKLEVYETSGGSGETVSSKHPQRNEERQVLREY